MRGQAFIVGTMLISFLLITYSLLLNSLEEEKFSITEPIFERFRSQGPKELCLKAELLPASGSCDIFDTPIALCGINITIVNGNILRRFKYVSTEENCNVSYLLSAEGPVLARTFVFGDGMIKLAGNLTKIYAVFNGSGYYLQGQFYGEVFVCLKGGEKPMAASNELPPLYAATFCDDLVKNLPENTTEVEPLTLESFAFPPQVLFVCKNISYSSFSGIERVRTSGGAIVGYMAYCSDENCFGREVLKLPSNISVVGLLTLSNFSLPPTRIFVRNCPIKFAVSSEDAELSPICGFVDRSGTKIVVVTDRAYITKDILNAVLRYFGMEIGEVGVERCG